MTNTLTQRTLLQEVEVALANYERSGLASNGDAEQQARCRANYLLGWLESAGYDMSGMIDELTFACYVYNRQQAPHVAPERWQAVFGDEAVVFEYRYQAQ